MFMLEYKFGHFAIHTKSKKSSFQSHNNATFYSKNKRSLVCSLNTLPIDSPSFCYSSWVVTDFQQPKEHNLLLLPEMFLSSD